MAKLKFIRVNQTLRKPPVLHITHGIRCAVCGRLGLKPHSGDPMAMLRIVFDKVSGTSYTLNVMGNGAVEFR
ncbi:MAG: hypothetical protein LBD23_08305 [Oscillospiraceae bacterium]|nr:hypothetical protein [Oscillospiraceae bacterium]